MIDRYELRKTNEKQNEDCCILLKEFLSQLHIDFFNDKPNIGNYLIKHYLIIFIKHG